jgi:hypothetical protein
MADEPPKNVATLFTKATGAEAGRASASKAEQERLEARAQVLERIAVAAEIVTFYDEHYPDAMSRSKLLKAAGMKVASQVLMGQVECSNGSQAATLIKELVNAGRLEAGESTSSADLVTSEERAERIKALREQLDQNTAASVRAVGAS